LLIAFFYGGMHFTLIGLAAKLKNNTLNYLAIGLGVSLILISTGYFAVKCVLKYRSLTAKRRERSES